MQIQGENKQTVLYLIIKRDQIYMTEDRQNNIEFQQTAAGVPGNLTFMFVTNHWSSHL